MTTTNQQKITDLLAEVDVLRDVEVLQSRLPQDALKAIRDEFISLVKTGEEHILYYQFLGLDIRFVLKSSTMNGLRNSLFVCIEFVAFEVPGDSLVSLGNIVEILNDRLPKDSHDDEYYINELSTWVHARPCTKNFRDRIQKLNKMNISLQERCGDSYDWKRDVRDFVGVD